jgi:hypothetical protein
VKSAPEIGVPTAAEPGTEIYGVVGGGVAMASACAGMVRAFVGDALKATHGFQKRREKSLGVKESLVC